MAPVATASRTATLIDRLWVVHARLTARPRLANHVSRFAVASGITNARRYPRSLQTAYRKVGVLWGPFLTQTSRSLV